MKTKFTLLLLSLALFLTTITSSAFAQDHPGYNNLDSNMYVISQEAVDFLEAHHVDLTPFKSDVFYSQSKQLMNSMQEYQVNILNVYNEDLLSFKQQSEIYGFSDEQVQQYVQGLVTTTPTVVKAKNSDFSIMATPYSTRVAPEGLGYEVESNAGYYQTTSFATIPAAQVNNGTSGYLFNSVSASSGWVIDVGLWYGIGYYGPGWRAFYFDGVNQIPVTGIISELTPGKEVYFSTTLRTDGYLETKILDASNFSTVYANFIYYVSDRGLYRTNSVFNRQITLCNDNHVFTDGSYMHNAKFTNAYLYSTTGFSQFSSANTKSTRRGAFGSNNTTRNKVIVNSYSEWHSEDVSITY